MSEETKKDEQIEQEPKQKVEQSELAEKDLDQVAGGSNNLNLSKSN